MQCLDLTFESHQQYQCYRQLYGGGCSGERSDCCTRVCTRAGNDEQNSASNLDAWEKYLEVNAGVLQY